MFLPNEGNLLFVDDNGVIFIVQADNSATGALLECPRSYLCSPLTPSRLFLSHQAFSLGALKAI